MILEIFFLISYWIIFWRKFLANPYLLCTSEIASTNFPHWIWMGRKWQAKDDIYYKEPASIPFLSMWYWPSVLMSKVVNWMTIDNSFRLYVYFILGHYLLASIIAYKLLGIFGAITLTYAGYCIKPQTPSFVYTMCWIPGIFLGGWFGAFSAAMAILGGYWPILVYVLPVAVLIQPAQLLMGLVLSLPQIIPFMWYWKRSVRAGEKIDRNLGKLNITDLKYLFIPKRSTGLVNGVHYPEAEMYMGIAVLFIWQASLWWFYSILVLLILVGLLPSFQRIPARSLYLLTLSFSFLCASTQKHTHMNPHILLILQGFLLYRNSSIYPSFPFTQWWKKPSELYAGSRNVANYPFQSGYLFGDRTLGYHGAFALK